MFFLKKNTKNKEDVISFDDLSSKKKAKIIREAVRKSNEDQLELIKKYERIYGKD
jgi:putative heme iron utilization protein